MPERRNIPIVGYKVMLFLATVIWGAAFVVMKDAVQVLGPAQLVGVRFLLAGLVLAAIFHKRLQGMFSPGGMRAGAIGITIIQFVCCGVLGLVFGALFESAPDFAAIPPSFFGELAYLVYFRLASATSSRMSDLPMFLPRKGLLSFRWNPSSE